MSEIPYSGRGAGGCSVSGRAPHACEYLGAKGSEGCKGMSGTQNLLCATHTLAP